MSWADGASCRPTWLDLAHRRFDAAVFDAHGWPHDLTDDQILERLLGLNLERAGATAEGTGTAKNAKKRPRPPRNEQTR